MAQNDTDRTAFRQLFLSVPAGTLDLCLHAVKSQESLSVRTPVLLHWLALREPVELLHI